MRALIEYSFQGPFSGASARLNISTPAPVSSVPEGSQGTMQRQIPRIIYRVLLGSPSADRWLPCPSLVTPQHDDKIP